MRNFTRVLGIVLLFICQHALGQDVILKVTGEEIKAKVKEITPSLIQYTQPEMYADNVLSLARSEVFMVKFANGEKELMQPVTPSSNSDSVVLSSSDLYQLGQKDAKLYYKGVNAVLGSMGATLLFGLPGTILVAAIPPKVNPKEVPNPTLLSNQYYYSGYRAQAHKRKIGKAAIGAGLTVLTLVTIMTSASLTQ